MATDEVGGLGARKKSTRRWRRVVLGSGVPEDLQGKEEQGRRVEIFFPRPGRTRRPAIIFAKGGFQGIKKAPLRALLAPIRFLHLLSKFTALQRTLTAILFSMNTIALLSRSAG